MPEAVVPDPRPGRRYDCAAGPAPGPNGGLSDVPVGSVSCKDVGHVRALGIVDGFPDGTYGTAKFVTRAQMAKFLVNGFHLTFPRP